MNNDQIEKGFICPGCWASFYTGYQLGYHIQYGCPANSQTNTGQGQSQVSNDIQLPDLAALTLEMARHEREGAPSPQQPSASQPARSLQVIRCSACYVQIAASNYHLQQVTECPACHLRFATKQQPNANQTMTNTNVNNSSDNQKLSIQQGITRAPAAPSYPAPAPQVWSCPVCQRQFSTAAQCNGHIQAHLQNFTTQGSI